MFASTWRPWYLDPVIDSRPALSFPYTVRCLVRLWIHVFRHVTKNFLFFCVNWWITDPEVDSRLHFALEMWTLFYCPLYLVVTCSLFGGESFSPDDAYVSALDSVMPMKGKHTINYLLLALFAWNLDLIS